MQVFEYESYAEAISVINQERKLRDSKWTLIRLATLCQMQPSYVTNVLKGRAHFSSDQLFRICDVFGLSSDETDYLELLLEYQKTTSPKRKMFLQAKIDKISRLQNRADKTLEVKSVDLSPTQLTRFYLDPLAQLVHIYLSSATTKNTTQSLAKKFKVSLTQMENVINTLEDIKYLRRKASHFEILVEGRHLPSDSPILKPHQILMRIKSLEQMQRLQGDDLYSFSATISTSPEVKAKIRNEFLKFLKVAEKLVRANAGEELYQLNFDLFPWEITDP